MTPAQFFQELKTHVDAVTPDHVNVHLGMAPAYEAGRSFHPYVIVWPSPGAPIDDRLVDGRMGTEATGLTFQVTTAAPDTLNLLHITADVQDALSDVRIGNNLVRPDVIVNRDARPLPDESLRPVRYFMATTWQTTLTRSLTV